MDCLNMMSHFGQSLKVYAFSLKLISCPGIISKVSTWNFSEFSNHNTIVVRQKVVVDRHIPSFWWVPSRISRQKKFCHSSWSIQISNFCDKAAGKMRAKGLSHIRKFFSEMRLCRLKIDFVRLPCCSWGRGGRRGESGGLRFRRRRLLRRNNLMLI